MQIVATHPSDDHGPSAAVPWWSFTKTLIATACLRLVEMGQLKLDRPLAPMPYTLRQLLQHQSGLTDYGPLPAYQEAVARGDRPWSVDELLTKADAARLRYQPGAGWAYSNIGYLKLRQLIESTTGKSLAEALADLVFKPAGAMAIRVVEFPDDLRGIEMGTAQAYHPGWVYHGLVVGPLTQAAMVLHRLLAGQLIGKAMLAEMQQGYRLAQFKTPPWEEPSYGLGLMVPITTAGFRAFGHNGGGPSSNLALYGAQRLAGLVVVGIWSSDETAEAVEIAAIDLLARLIR